MIHAKCRAGILIPAVFTFPTSTLTLTLSLEGRGDRPSPRPLILTRRRASPQREGAAAPLTIVCDDVGAGVHTRPQANVEDSSYRSPLRGIARHET